MRAVDIVRRLMDRLLGGISIFLFALMTVVGTYQIVVRYFFNRPSTVSEELLTYAFTWMALLSAAYVFGKRDHMRMGFLADRLGEQPKKILDLIIELLIFLFAAVVLVRGGIEITSLTMSQRTASLGIPMGYVYLVIPICGVLTAVYSLLNAADLLWGAPPSSVPNSPSTLKERQVNS